jgi:hypothetical protein
MSSISGVRSLYFRIFSASFFITVLYYYYYYYYYFSLLQGDYNCIPETNHVSRVHNIPAILWLQCTVTLLLLLLLLLLLCDESIDKPFAQYQIQLSHIPSEFRKVVMFVVI